MPAFASAQVPQAQRERREELETLIIQRFLNHTATELELAGESRNRLEQHLRQSAPRRRALAHSTVQLRGQILRAVRDETTSDAEFTRLINETTRLRDQEEALWKSDQEALSRILTPRQHARFVIMWLRFNEQVRDMAMRRPQEGGAGRPGQSGFRQPIRRP
jgi:hypothetical protein